MKLNQELILKKIPKDIADLLFEKAEFYNKPDFIVHDPIQIPHSFSRKEDIEISGFLTSVIAWGNRTSIIKNANYLITLMDRAPYSFLKNADEKEFLRFSKFVHRTFNGDDCLGFIYSLKYIYSNHGGLENVFTKGYDNSGSVDGALVYFREVFMSNIELPRTGKHISDISKGSAAKRLNLFLRWMVRNDKKGVDFGLWKNIPSSALYIPLDVHSGNIARRLSLLNRKQNDWKSVVELTKLLSTLDPMDPTRFDFALFGIGVNKEK